MQSISFPGRVEGGLKVLPPHGAWVTEAKSSRARFHAPVEPPVAVFRTKFYQRAVYYALLIGGLALSFRIDLLKSLTVNNYSIMRYSFVTHTRI